MHCDVQQPSAVRGIAGKPCPAARPTLTFGGTTSLVNFVYNIPSVRGPQNNAAKLTTARLLSAPVLFLHARSCPGGRGGLQCSSSTQALSIASVSSFQKPLIGVMLPYGSGVADGPLSCF